MEIRDLLRENIRGIKPYSSARDEYSGAKGVFLDANENPLGSVLDQDYNRYPDPYQARVKDKLGSIVNMAPQQIFLGNGSDEAIDLIFRAFCEPRLDNVITLPPTYGMYRVCADINDVTVKEVSLTEDFQLDVVGILKAVDSHTKAIFVCSPNNPTGNLMRREDIISLLSKFQGLVVVDEAYIDFSSEPSFTRELSSYPNLIVLQTFSKAWGLAALRFGMAFASEEIISVFNKIKYPYNLNEATQQMILEAMDHVVQKKEMVQAILEEKAELFKELQNLPLVSEIFPSDANFWLVRMEGATQVYNYLVDQLIIVRNRSSVQLCHDSLRITVGTKEENQRLIDALKNYHS